jgi:tetratricopeptide (TPR) repeat protein
MTTRTMPFFQVDDCFVRLLPVAALTLLLGACASTGPVTPPSGEAVAKVPQPPAAPAQSRYRQPEVAAYRPPVRPTHARPQTARAVRSLLERARQQQAEGQLMAAANTLERALRIEPDNALVWNRLAHVRFQQGQYAQAANLAEKSRILAGGDEALRADNEGLIQRAQAHR